MPGSAGWSEVKSISCSCLKQEKRLKRQTSSISVWDDVSTPKRIHNEERFQMASATFWILASLLATHTLASAGSVHGSPRTIMMQILVSCPKLRQSVLFSLLIASAAKVCVVVRVHAVCECVTVCMCGVMHCTTRNVVKCQLKCPLKSWFWFVRLCLTDLSAWPISLAQKYTVVKSRSSFKKRYGRYSFLYLLFMPVCFLWYVTTHPWCWDYSVHWC